MKTWLTSAAGAVSGRAEQNLKKNTAAFGAHRGLVHGQRTKPACDMVYGTYPMSWNGCELIAVANVMELLGKPVPLPQVVYEFELNRMHYLFSSGYWGTGPKALGRYFDAHGIAYSSARRPRDLEALAKNSTCGIISFWNNKRKGRVMINFFSGGLHTVAYRYDGRRYYLYNLHSYDQGPRAVPDLREAYEGKRFIIGYTFK